MLYHVKGQKRSVEDLFSGWVLLAQPKIRGGCGGGVGKGGGGGWESHL